MKKWDKRSKSQTKELYLSRAVEVQPVFHREELAQISDLASTSILELEAWADGESVIFEGKGSSDGISSNDSANQTTNSNSSIQNKNQQRTNSSKTQTQRPQSSSSESRATDDLYHEFIKTASSDHDNIQNIVSDWISRLSQLDSAKDRITNIFLLSIPTKASDEALLALYNSGYVNIQNLDEISNQSVLHKACIAGRTVIVDLALQQSVDPTLQDTYGRTALHYACIHNHPDLIKKLVDHGADINALDKDNFSPLLCSIITKHSQCLNLLLELGAKGDDDSEKYYIPLNFACQNGDYEAAKMLLSRWPSVIKPDAEGLYPIHIVARAGHDKLIPLLIPYNNVNQIDKLNKWTALFYAASEGHVTAVKELLKAKAQADILDEDGHTPLYYATWEGHVECMDLLSRALAINGASLMDQSRPIPINKPTDTVTNNIHDSNNNFPDHSSSITQKANSINESSLQKIYKSYSKTEGTFSSSSSSFSPNEMDIESGDIDGIPDLALPPPILPFRRYGHNFLDKKAFVQLIFEVSATSKPIRFDKGENSLPAGRLTIASRNNHDIIPQSLMLPISDNDRIVSFQVDSLDNFAIDFEIYPTYGTKIVAKTAALSYIFNSTFKDLPEYQILGTRHSCTLPLFDMRLQTVGSITFAFQIVLPFSGEPLEITKFDTYWKSTSQVEQGSSTGNSSFPSSLSHNSGFPSLGSSQSHSGINVPASSQSQVQMLLQSQRSGSPLISSTMNSIISGSPAAPPTLSLSNNNNNSNLLSGSFGSSTNVNNHHNNHGISQALSFVTASSLSGEFSRIKVCLTSDLIPVVCGSWSLNINGVELPIGNLKLDQILNIVSSTSFSGFASSQQYIDNTIHQITNATSPEALHKACHSRIIPLSKFLEAAPLEAKLDISVLYATRVEAIYMNLGINTFPDLNIYVDKILTVIFDHVRSVRSTKTQNNAPFGSTPSQTRSIIFSSAHPDVCTVLNWKQPNFPVFFHVNSIEVHPKELISLAKNPQYDVGPKTESGDADGDIDLPQETESSTATPTQESIDNNVTRPAFKVVSAHGLPVSETDKRCTSLKDAAMFAASNNILGIICSSSLLNLVPGLVDSIRVFGLVLVSETKSEDETSLEASELTHGFNLKQEESKLDQTPMEKDHTPSVSSNVSNVATLLSSSISSTNDNMISSVVSAFPSFSCSNPTASTKGTNQFFGNGPNNNQTKQYGPPGIDGIRTLSVLTFRGAIDM